MNKIPYQSGICVFREGKLGIRDSFFISNAQHKLNHALCLSEGIVRLTIRTSIIFSTCTKVGIS